MGGQVRLVKRFRLDPDNACLKELLDHRDYFHRPGGSVVVDNEESDGVGRTGDEIMSVAVFLDASEVGHPVEFMHLVAGETGNYSCPAAAKKECLTTFGPESGFGEQRFVERG